MRPIILLLYIFKISLNLLAQDHTFIPFGSDWRYLDDGSNQGSLWQSVPFDDSSWNTGLAEFGYGDGDENTIVNYGSNTNNKHVTTYFRHSFNIADVSLYKNFLIKLIKDDGALVYVNGQNVMRSNFGTGTYEYNDLAYSSISGSEETIVWEELIPPSYFQNGTNTIAVEVHQYIVTSIDFSFDLELIGFDSIPDLYRTPYLQKSTPTSMTIKWKTNIPTTSRVNYGLSLNSITNVVDSLSLTTNHEVTISGLTPNTKYFYSVGNSTTDFTTSSSSYFFKTNPIVGNDEKCRIWVTGDAGTGKTGQLNVRDAYLNYTGTTEKADLWLMMGDNAYEHGREADYHMGLFNVYESILKNTVSFPTSGNHDFYGEASPITETGTYFDIFALPKHGECGGVASETEAYYSFDYGNIHFISLESYALDRDSTGAMATWLKNDLQNNTSKWLIAYWHYAPYTKVGHDSDNPNDHSGRAIDMRENINPILEQYGVDLVLSGHSHGYERSYLLNGHYGFSNTLESSMIFNPLSGKANQTGAYLKPSTLTPHQGTVYMVCGSSGKLSSTSVTHPVMYTTNTDYLGSALIDISGDTLEGKFLNEHGIIQDYFHIVKSTAINVENVKATKTISLWPNPVTSSFKIAYDGKSDLKINKIQIYSSNGQLVKTVFIEKQYQTDGEYTVNIEDLKPGIYTVKLIGENELLKSEPLLIQN